MHIHISHNHNSKQNKKFFILGELPVDKLCYLCPCHLIEHFTHCSDFSRGKLGCIFRAIVNTKFVKNPSHIRFIKKVGDKNEIELLRTISRLLDMNEYGNINSSLNDNDKLCDKKFDDLCNDVKPKLLSFSNKYNVGCACKGKMMSWFNNYCFEQKGIIIKNDDVVFDMIIGNKIDDLEREFKQCKDKDSVKYKLSKFFNL